MADSNEPKKETVHISVSSRPSSPASQPAESRPTVRIHLPIRPPANPLPVPADLSSPARVAAAAMPAPMTTPAPKKETVRMTLSPNPQPMSAVQMKKTQPLIDLSAIEAPATAVTLAPAPLPERQRRVDQVSMPLCWMLLAASVAILILQIWNYVS